MFPPRSQGLHAQDLGACLLQSPQPSSRDTPCLSPWDFSRWLPVNLSGECNIYGGRKGGKHKTVHDYRLSVMSQAQRVTRPLRRRRGSTLFPVTAAKCHHIVGPRTTLGCRILSGETSRAPPQCRCSGSAMHSRPQEYSRPTLQRTVSPHKPLSHYKRHCKTFCFPTSSSRGRWQSNTNGLTHLLGVDKLP